MTGPRDWDKDLAEIDKMMGAPTPKGAGAAEPRPSGRGDLVPSPAPGQSPAPQATRQQGAPARVRPVTLWLVTLLGPLGAAGLAIWPYQKACGLPLGVYLVGALAVWGASIWGMRTAWAAQRAAAMVIGVITLIASLTLVALEVLPRVGYARTSLTWTCST